MPRSFSQKVNPCSDQVQSPTAIYGKRLSDLPADQSPDTAGSMPCIIYECGPDLIVTAISPHAFELIGIRSENIVGKKTFWEERLTAQDRAQLMARIEQLDSTHFASEVHKITDDKGLPVWVAHSLQKRKSGHPSRILGCIVPLPTDLGATALDTGIISQFIHKIGNHYQLMNFLIGSLQRSGTNAGEIEALQQTVDRAVEFTRAFSHYSQPSTGLSKVDICELLRSAARAIAPAFSEKNIAFRDFVEPSVSGVFVDGDGFLLELALRALLQNALEAAKSGDSVVLSGSRDINDSYRRQVACISIVDTGCGMEEELLEKAAEPFISSKRDREGLGLSTAVRIIEMHGGILKVASSAGQGTKIEILLPIRKEAGSD